MPASALVGVWKLVSYELRGEDGGVTYPYGREAAGYLTYTEDGYVSGIFTAGGRPAFSTTSFELRAGSAEEIVAAARGCVAYAGRYEVENDRVVHHVEVSLFPNWTGTDLVRFFEVAGDRLTISTRPIVVDGVRGRAYLVWQRASGR